MKLLANCQILRLCWVSVVFIETSKGLLMKGRTFFYMTLDNNASANCVSEIVCFLHYSIRMSSSEKSAIWEDSSSVFWFYFSFSQNPSVSGGCLRICQRGWRTKVVKKEDFIIRSLCQLCWIIENRNGVVHNAFARVLG